MAKSLDIRSDQVNNIINITATPLNINFNVYAHFGRFFLCLGIYNQSI